MSDNEEEEDPLKVDEDEAARRWLEATPSRSPSPDFSVRSRSIESLISPLQSGANSPDSPRRRSRSSSLQSRSSVIDQSGLRDEDDDAIGSPRASRSRSSSAQSRASSFVFAQSPSPASQRSRTSSVRSISPEQRVGSRSSSREPDGNQVDEEEGLMRNRSVSPSLRSRSASRSTEQSLRSRSVSPSQRSPSRSPEQSLRSRSVSPSLRSRSPSRSPEQNLRSRSVSPLLRSRSPSRSPEQKRRRLITADSSDSEDETEKVKNKKRAALLRDSTDSSDSNSEGAEESVHEPKSRTQHERRESEEEEDEDVRRDEDDAGKSGACDFDLMLERKRQENRRYRKRRDINLINDNDDAIAKLIADMRQAAREDRDLNLARQPATRKMMLFPTVMNKLGKVDLQMAFVEANILSVMTDWLAPLPYDKSLPHVRIRTEFLRYLKELPIDDLSRLKESGIGKAVMYLYRHPKEIRPNKDLSGKIINQWSRPIFNLCTDFSTMSKEDRQKRDEEMGNKLSLNKRRRRTRSTSEQAGPSDKAALRPGDPGWVCRARVPMPDNKEFIVRPQWQSHIDLSHARAKEISLLEKHKRKFADKKKLMRQQHAVKISIEGKNMNL